MQAEVISSLRAVSLILDVSAQRSCWKRRSKPLRFDEQQTLIRSIYSWQKSGAEITIV